MPKVVPSVGVVELHWFALACSEYRQIAPVLGSIVSLHPWFSRGIASPSRSIRRGRRLVLMTDRDEV